MQLNDLPAALLERVCALCDVESLVALTRTCRRLREGALPGPAAAAQAALACGGARCGCGCAAPAPQAPAAPAAFLAPAAPHKPHASPPWPQRRGGWLFIYPREAEGRALDLLAAMAQQVRRGAAGQGSGTGARGWARARRCRGSREAAAAC
jgi:hypothetical protein